MSYRSGVFYLLGCSASLASAQSLLDQISPGGSSLSSVQTFGVDQIFESQFSGFTSAVADDFVASNSVVTDVSVAFEATDPTLGGRLSQAIRGWRVSFFSTAAVFTNSGFDFNTGAVATTLAATNINYTQIFGTGTTNQTFRADITGLNMSIGSGARWVCITPYLDFTGNGQVFLLQNGTPANRGGGGVSDSIAANPGLGFGLGLSILANYDASYAVNAVPEPSLAFFGILPLGMLFRRHRASV